MTKTRPGTKTPPGTKPPPRAAAPASAGETSAPRADRPSASRAARLGGKKLVIVESPAKAKTINRYLGPDFIVKASMGHVRDLPGKELGVDVEHDFQPTYELLAGRKRVLVELRQLARSAPEVFLATDLDREGEAIAWHLAEALKVPDERLRRVVFNEITKPAIQEAFAHAGKIDQSKVDAQQARRILDRIVGYKVSPLLWRKVAAGLSAGRVQTVAVRLIVERERAIQAFVPEEFWKIAAIFTPQPAAGLERAWQEFLASSPADAQADKRRTGPSQAEQFAFLARHNAFRAELAEWNGQRFRCDDVRAALEVASALGLHADEPSRTEDPRAKGPAQHRITVGGRVHDGPAGAAPPRYVVEAVSERKSFNRPPAPFTTATLQQAASVGLYFSASHTMRVAQQLYEGVELGGEGSVGLITYMRTDSLNVSTQAIGQARSFIEQTYGDKYRPDKPNVYRSGPRAQAAHEAIRPTDVTRTPDSLRGVLDARQFKLYDLIWRRFVACQMTPAEWMVTDVSIAAETPAGKGVFKAIGRRLAFDGYLKVAGLPRHDEQTLPSLQQTAEVFPVTVSPTQHFTQAPPRYTEASLVKALEAEGIGRPSTYAAIIQTIQDRGYVQQTERRFHATELGMKVTDKLVAAFPNIFDVSFTARMEERLDEVEEARVDWVTVLKDFYGPFEKDLEKAAEEMVHAKAETEPSEYKCPACGKAMVYRWSKNGRYLACTGYPDCKTTFPVDQDGRKLEAKETDVACPKCGGLMLLRRGRFGPFLSCSRYPACDGVVNLDKKGGVKLPAPPPLTTEEVCPKCGKPLYLRRGGRGPWLSCSGFPKCRGRMGWKTLKPDRGKELELALLNHEKANPVPQVKRTTDGSLVPAGYVPRITNEPAAEEAEGSDATEE